MIFYLRLLTAFFVMVGSTSAMAAEMPFTQKAFDEARAAGKPVVIHVHSRWCMTCRRQASIVTPMLNRPEFKDLLLLRADYGTEKAPFKQLNVHSKSTFIVFKGKAEVGRSIGDTDEQRIAALFRKAL